MKIPEFHFTVRQHHDTGRLHNEIRILFGLGLFQVPGNYENELDCLIDRDFSPRKILAVLIQPLSPDRISAFRFLTVGRTFL